MEQKIHTATMPLTFYHGHKMCNKVSSHFILSYFIQVVYCLSRLLHTLMAAYK